MFPRFDAQHDAGIGENNGDGIDYRDGKSDKPMCDKMNAPPPERAFPRRTTSGLMLSYSDASIFPVRQRP